MGMATVAMVVEVVVSKSIGIVVVIIDAVGVMIAIYSVGSGSDWGRSRRGDGG